MSLVAHLTLGVQEAQQVLKGLLRYIKCYLVAH